MKNLCYDIFEDNDSIDKKKFIEKVKSVHNNYNSNIVFTIFELMKIEFELIKSEYFVNYFMKNNNTNVKLEEYIDNKGNYYLKTIDKLLNKCVFNGDEKCNCKKC